MAKALGVTLPLQLGSNGYFQSTTDIKTQLKSNVINLLLTKKGERLMQPEFGSELQGVIFENETDEGLANVNIIVNDAIKKWMPFLVVTDITVSRDPNHNKIIITISYRINTTQNINDVVQLTF
jgi:phage baseplate assembly protein W